DLNSPEINSIVVPVPTVAGFPSCNVGGKPRDTTNTSSWTNSFQNIQCYDLQKVQILLNEIDGKQSDGATLNPPRVPAIFGMNFQAVSVGQKLVDSHTPPLTGGYVDPLSTFPTGQIGVPSPSLLSEIQFVDAAIGTLVSGLKAKGLYQSTTIIIGAKHGQSP